MKNKNPNTLKESRIIYKRQIAKYDCCGKPHKDSNGCYCPKYSENINIKKELTLQCMAEELNLIANKICAETYDEGDIAYIFLVSETIKQLPEIKVPNNLPV